MADWYHLREQYETLVWSTAYRILAHRADAFDCTQEVFLEAFKNEQARAVTNWGGLLRWLATRRAIDALRKRERRTTESLRFETIDRRASPAAELAEQDELMQRVRAELRVLPETQATAFWLACIEQTSHAEIAQQMHTTESAVSMLVFRARQQLKQKLSDLSPTRVSKP